MIMTLQGVNEVKWVLFTYVQTFLDSLSHATFAAMRICKLITVCPTSFVRLKQYFHQVYDY